MNYHRTKYLAEKEVRRGIEQGLDAVMINPANIIGSYDYRGWSQLFILIDRQKLPGVAPAIHTFCHAREVARAHIAAFHKGKTGENYLLGGIEIDFLNLAREIGIILGRPTPKRPTPVWILKLIGRLSLWVSYITGKEPDITPEKVFLITNNMLCNSQKAERELDYNPASLKIMLDDCYQWMLSKGMIDQKQ
jgi:nucleoside-diphosphate-sugar epimerase